MTQEQKLLKAKSILSDGTQYLSQKLEEVEKLLASTSPAKGRKKAKNEKMEWMIEFDKQYRKPLK